MKKIMIIALSLCVLFSMSAFAQEDQALTQRQSELQAIINANGGGWTVGDSDIARMSDEEFRKRLGALDSEYVPTFSGGTAPVQAAALPSSYSLKQYMTSVKNQGSCGSCWAYAVNACFEGVLKKDTGKSYDLSEQLLVSTCCSAGDCGGGYPDQVGQYLVNTGVPEESCYPYQGSNSQCSQACSGWKSKAIKAKNNYKVTESVNGIKSAIHNYGPVNLGFQVFGDFRNYSGGVYKHYSGSSEGWHAVAAVGWNDSTSSFTVKNSWGSGWGESGYFRIGYDQVTNSVAFGKWANVLEGKTNPGPNPDPDPTPNNSCKGNCGGKAPSGCYCDSFCESYGDCCADKKQQCGF